MVVAAIREWFERQGGHEDQEDERAFLEAQKRDLLLLIADLDEKERKLHERRQRKRDNDDG